MVFGARKAERVSFERGYAAMMMAIDGTWRRDCLMLDVSGSGARLLVEGSIDSLNLKEFFLLLSSMGVAYRRCELIRVNGNELGVRFLEKKTSKRSSRNSTDADQRS
jgi:hypothetical protein